MGIRPGRNALMSGLFVLLTACGNFSQRDSAPKNIPIDINRITDAVPRHEPPSRYGNPENYTVRGQTYYTLTSSKGFTQRGDASWYGVKFHGKRTSSGETYDMYRMTAAHKTLPLPTYVKVTNLDNGKQIVVKVNDRGPFHTGRIIDLSYVAALKLDIVKNGTGRVEIETIDTIASDDKEQTVYVQVGSFADKQNAKRIQNTLMASSIESDIYKVVIPERQALYRVRVGPFLQRSDALELLDSLSDLGVVGAQIFTAQRESTNIQ
ncbi:MAG TPA: septal ring lytic transglycosylase RlpA family protein [Gammaproteobacteria bacterium]|nr:septal ring lytic transglycosylase RlpA family protein [Gammaproteobacteria bacterium]